MSLLRRASHPDVLLARRLALGERARVRQGGPQGRTRVRPALVAPGNPTLVVTDFNIVKDSDPATVFHFIGPFPQGFSLRSFLKINSNGGVLERHWVYLHFGKPLDSSAVSYWGITFGNAAVENFGNNPAQIGLLGSGILGYVNTVLEDWDPDTLTWNNQPVDPGAAPTGSGAAPLMVVHQDTSIEPGATFWFVGSIQAAERLALIREGNMGTGLGSAPPGAPPVGLLVRAELMDAVSDGDLTCTLGFINDAFVSFQ